jgi:hypothetical protein
MSMPGFTAGASLYKTRRSWRAACPQQGGGGVQGAVPQLSVGSFPGSSGIGLFGGWGNKLCRLWCDIAWRSCLDTCEGTWENPKPSLNCVICDQQHTECLKACG